MMKYHTLSKETAEFVLQKFVAYILDDNYASGKLLSDGPISQTFKLL